MPVLFHPVNRKMTLFRLNWILQWQSSTKFLLSFLFKWIHVKSLNFGTKRIMFCSLTSCNILDSVTEWTPIHVESHFQDRYIKCNHYFLFFFVRPCAMWFCEALPTVRWTATVTCGQRPWLSNRMRESMLVVTATTAVEHVSITFRPHLPRKVLMQLQQLLLLLLSHRARSE